MKYGICALALLGGAFSAQAVEQAPTEPTSMVQVISDEAIAFLEDGQLTETEAQDLLSNVNVEAIGQFALGREVHSLSDAQLSSYHTAFREYLTEQMQLHLENFAGGEIEIVDTVERAEGDVVVETTLTPASGESMPVSWRVKDFDGQWKIIDVEAQGLWLAIEQRAQIRRKQSKTDKR